MALSPIGNITYINQNAQLGAIQHANNMSKPEFALTANMQEFVDKLKSVQEVSPTPQNEAIDPNNDEEKRKEQEEQEKTAQEEKTEALQEREKEAIKADSTPIKSTHILDVRA